MDRELALHFIDCVSKHYNGDDLCINLEISPKGYCVVFLRVKTPYRVPLSLIRCVEDLLFPDGDFGMLSFSCVRFNEEQNVMVHRADLFSKED